MESVIYILLNLFYDMSTHLAISSKTYIFVKIANINSFLRENQCIGHFFPYEVCDSGQC